MARNLLGVTQKVRNQARKLATDLGKKPWWNNGLNNKRSNTCPGDGYVPGKLPPKEFRRTSTLCPHCGMKCALPNLSRHIMAKHS